MVLPGTNQHRPLDTLTPTQGKKKKKLNNRQAVEKKKRHVAKTAGCPELWRVEEGHSFTQTVNKQASRRRQDWRPLPSNLGEEKACNSHGHVESTTRGGQGHFPTRTVNKQAGSRRQVWHHLPQCAWRGEGIQQQLKCGTLHQTTWEGHFPM
jgi:hypothetical protein